MPLSVDELIIDKEDKEKIKEYDCYFLKTKTNTYIRLIHKKTKQHTLIHRVVMNAPKNKEVDHIDSNGLNNKKSNLRLTNRTYNNLNRRGVKGYYYCKILNKYKAYIWVNNKKKYLGSFKEEQEASKAYEAEKEKVLVNYYSKK